MSANGDVQHEAGSLTDLHASFRSVARRVVRPLRLRWRPVDAVSLCDLREVCIDKGLRRRGDVQLASDLQGGPKVENGG